MIFNLIKFKNDCQVDKKADFRRFRLFPTVVVLGTCRVGKTTFIKAQKYPQCF